MEAPTQHFPALSDHGIPSIQVYTNPTGTRDLKEKRILHHVYPLHRPQIRIKHTPVQHFAAGKTRLSKKEDATRELY